MALSFFETPPAGVEESLVQAVVMHEGEAPSTRATQEASNPTIDALRTAVEKGVVARTDSQFMRDMGKDADAKREYDACTGRVAKTEFRRAWAERKLELVETQMSQSRSLVKQEFSHGVHRGILTHFKGRGVGIGKQQNSFAGRVLLQADTSGTPLPRCTSSSTLKMTATK